MKKFAIVMLALMFCAAPRIINKAQVDAAAHWLACHTYKVCTQ